MKQIHTIGMTALSYLAYCSLKYKVTIELLSRGQDNMLSIEEYFLGEHYRLRRVLASLHAVVWRNMLSLKTMRFSDGETKEMYNLICERLSLLLPAYSVESRLW